MNKFNLSKNSLISIFILSILTGCGFGAHSTKSNLTASDVRDTNTQHAILLPLASSKALSRNSASIEIPLEAVEINAFKIQSISAAASYFAASGRQCRNITLQSTNQQQSYIGCQKSAEQWVLIKAIQLN
ncbi:MAG: hypothetical protein OFPII_34810 [Osedax symbiont Rs1]|nr:MAG: hypothetical protein OFPII_34810 [Osedax symbiont Rs1]